MLPETTFDCNNVLVNSEFNIKINKCCRNVNYMLFKKCFVTMFYCHFLIIVIL